MFTQLSMIIKDVLRLRLILLSLGMGMAGASIMPVLSSHLALNLGVEPFWIGVVFAANTLSGIAISQWLANQSDTGLSRIKIIRYGVVVAFFAVIALGLASSYIFLVLSGVALFAAISPVQPQLFALAREVVVEEDATLFQSLLRATFSLSWIIGPPVAYILFSSIGFRGLAFICALIFLATLNSVRGFADSPLQLRSNDSPVTDPRLKWLVLAIAAVFAANNMYIVYMPIYLQEDLRLAAVAPGLLMGLAAGLEIPMMIYAGARANRWPLFSPLKVAAVMGTMFYISVFFSESLTLLLVVQIFNGAFIGIMAGLGISVFQALMKGRMGMASTLYTNAIKIGGLAGALGGGILAQFFGIRGVFIACTVMALVSLLSLHKASITKTNS